MLDRTFAALAGEGGRPPWLAPYAEAAARIAAARPAGGTVVEALAAAVHVDHTRGPLRFVPQANLPAGEAYEAFIARTGQVPTREHPHDLLNALVWARFPDLKAHLNRVQADEIARRGVGPQRGPVRDALTLFDESGAWLQAPEALVVALHQRAWRRAFADLRDLWPVARFVPFGHALLEQRLLTPHKGLTAHVWVVPEAEDAERWLCEALTPERLARKADFPLPLAGIPGWWPGNDRDDFLDDATVFRPMRR